MAENENNNIHGDYNFEADEVQEAGEGNSLIVPPPEEEEEDNKTGERRSNKVFYPTDEMIERIRNMSCYGQKLTENDLEVFKKTMVHQTVENAFVDPVLGRELDVVKMMVTKRDMDSVLACDGTEGSGKSVLALSLAKYLDPTFTIDRVCFMLDEFLEQLRTVPKYSAVILDEAYASAGARASMTEINRALVSVAAEMRQRNLFVFLCLPSFFDLDRYFALWRCRALIHVYINKHKQRGNYVIFPPHEKKLLYLWGRKLYKYTWPKSPFDVCHFKNEYVVDELEYRAKKALAFRSRCLSDSERKYTNTMKHKERVGRLAYFMKDYLGVPMPAIKSIAGTDTLTYIDSIRGSEVQINVDKVAKEIADVIKQTEIKEVMVPDKYVEQTLYNIYEVIKDSSSSQRVKHDIKALIKNLPPAILKGFIKKHDEVARTIANGIIPTDQGSIRLEVADEGVSEQVSDDVPTGEEDVESR